MNNTEINLRSYDNVEYVQLNEFSEEQRRMYLKEKMQSAETNADFINKYIFNGIPLNICEIGSGNSKLLYLLEQQKIMEKGVGYEVSTSRWKMANYFAKEVGSKKVLNINKNFLDDIPQNDIYDLIIMVDIVFNIIGSLYEDAEEEAISWMYRSLKPGGGIFLELQDCTDTKVEIARSGGVIRKWEEYDISDPFQYGLHEIKIDEDDNIVYEKIFIKRDLSGKDRFKNVIKSYSVNEISNLLKKGGFEVEVYPCFDSEKEEIEEIKKGVYKKELYRVLARKK